MSNKYSPDRLEYGGKRGHILAKNSSEDGDFSWQGFDTPLGITQTDAFNQSFGWQAKDYTLLALYDPNNRSNLSPAPGRILSNDTGHGRGTYIEFNNIPQNYHTLKITGDYFQYRGTNPNWLYMRFNQFSTTTNALYFSRWTFNNAAATVSSQVLDATSVWGIARGYQPDSFNASGFEITMPGYSIPGKLPHWFGTRFTNEQWGGQTGAGWSQGNVSPWNTVNSLLFFPSDGFIHPSSWIAIYGIK